MFAVSKHSFWLNGNAHRELVVDLLSTKCRRHREGDKMFKAPTTIQDVFQDQLLMPGSALLDALGQLSQLASGRGTCMFMEHPDHGITVIADADWHHDGIETRANRHNQSVFSIRDHEGFDTISVLVGVSDREELDAMKGDCAIAIAAIDLMASVSAARAMIAA
jgi:hypothetical protein